jgi:hypothetical protein
VREVAPDLPPAFAAVLQQAMDRDPNRRPSTAGELLARLDAALNSPNGDAGGGGWRAPRAGRGGLGVGAIVLVLVGAAEVAWMVEGSGLTILTHGAHRLFGG